MAGSQRSIACVVRLAGLCVILLPALVYAQSGREFTDGVQLFEDGQYERAINTLSSVVKSRPEAESAWYYLGRAHLKMPTPDLQAASDAFQHAIELNPHRPGIRLYLGKIYEDQAAYDEAVQVYQEELRLRRGRDVGDINMVLGRVYYRQNNYDRAIATLSALTRAEPLNVECLYYLGLAETASGLYEEALAHLESANELCREYKSLHSRLERGELTVVEQRQKGLTEEYLAQHYGNAHTFVSEMHLWPALNKAVGDTRLKMMNWAQARNAYRRCLDLEQGGNPADPEPHTLVALAYLRDAQDLFHNQGLLFQCISVTEAALESVAEALKNNESYAPAHLAQAQIYLFQARTYVTMPELKVESHTYDDVLASLQKAIELREDYADAIQTLGVVLTDIGQYEEAVEAILKVIALRPGDAEAHAALSKAYLGQEKATKALEEAQTALALDNKNYNALLCAALVDFYYQQRMSSAIDYLTRAIDVDPSKPDAYLELGNVYFQMSSWYRARHEYLNALQRIPYAVIANTAMERARVNFLIAHTYHHAKLYDKEVEYLNNALALYPSYVEALRQIARAYEAREEYRAAQVALETGLESSPDEATDAQINVQLGQMYERMGRPHDAIAAYTAAVTADDTNYDARRGLERLGAHGSSGGEG